MANLNISVNSVQNGTLIDGKYWFLVRFYNSLGILINDIKYPQNQVVSADLPLPKQISIEVAEGNYTITNVIAKLFPISELVAEKNLTGTIINCNPQCIVPVYSNYNIIKPLCEDGVTNNIGSISVNGLTSYNKYKLFQGTPTLGYDTATTGSGSTISLPVNFPTIEGSSLLYTLRFYNGSETCHTDLSFYVLYEECSIGECCDITPGQVIIDGNDLSNCDLIQTESPSFRMLGSTKQVRVYLYSARPNIGPFTYRIYNSTNNLVQVINSVIDPSIYYDLNSNLPDGIYSITVEDSKGCPPTSPKTFVIDTGGVVTNNLETFFYITD